MALCSATLALLCLMFVGNQVLDCGEYCVALFCCYVLCCVEQNRRRRVLGVG